jgi:hypothetical protein
MNTEIDSTLDIQADLKARADAELVVAQGEQARQDAEIEQRLQARFRENVHTFLSDRWDMPPEQIERVAINAPDRMFTIGTWVFTMPNGRSASLVTGLCPTCGAPRTTYAIEHLEELAKVLNDPNPAWHSTCECPIDNLQPDAVRGVALVTVPLISKPELEYETQWEYLTAEQRSATMRLSEAILDLVATAQ